MRSRERHLFFSSKDNRTVIHVLTRQDFFPDRTADGVLLFTFSSSILDFRRSLSSYLEFGEWHEDSSRFYRQQGRLATRNSPSACFKNRGQLFQVQWYLPDSLAFEPQTKQTGFPVCYMSRLSLQQQRKNNRSEPKQSTRYFYQHKSNFQTTEWIIYKVLSLYYLHLFPPIAAVFLLGSTQEARVTLTLLSCLATSRVHP